MSFTHYSVDAAIETSQAFWRQDSVAEHVALCDYDTTLPLFLGCLPKGEAILDAGCGLARWVIYLRDRGYKVFGVDRAHRALSQARRFEERTPLFCGDTTHLPLANEVLGGIISLGVIEHVESGPVPALRELRRVLYPGGLALVAVPYNNPWRRGLINHLSRLRAWQSRRAGLKLEFAEYRFSARELSGFLEAAGFQVLSVHADDFRPPLGKGLCVDSRFFGCCSGVVEVPLGRKRWELNLCGRILHRIANRISPWLVAGGVLAVARRK